MIDTTNQIDTIHREVAKKQAEAGEVVSVLLRRSYDTSIEDVWSAVTDPQRIKRWFMPVSGDLREGGDFALEGNASGKILRCDPPKLLRTTFGDESSIVEVRLTANGEDGTTLELEHSVPMAMAGSGAGALYVGPGWDGAVMGLGLYLAGTFTDDPVAAANSPEVIAFNGESIEKWSAVVEASGTATPEELAAGVEASRAQFTPDAGADGSNPA
jgi:uncharacterized protein YndB with AHSA1/START domain